MSARSRHSLRKKFRSYLKVEELECRSAPTNFLNVPMPESNISILGTEEDSDGSSGLPDGSFDSELAEALDGPVPVAPEEEPQSGSGTVTSTTQTSDDAATDQSTDLDLLAATTIFVDPIGDPLPDPLESQQEDVSAATGGGLISGSTEQVVAPSGTSGGSPGGGGGGSGGGAAAGGDEESSFDPPVGGGTDSNSIDVTSTRTADDSATSEQTFGVDSSFTLLTAPLSAGDSGDSGGEAQQQQASAPGAGVPSGLNAPSGAVLASTVAASVAPDGFTGGPFTLVSGFTVDSLTSFNPGVTGDFNITETVDETIVATGIDADGIGFTSETTYTATLTITAGLDTNGDWTYNENYSYVFDTYLTPDTSAGVDAYIWGDSGYTFNSSGSATDTSFTLTAWIEEHETGSQTTSTNDGDTTTSMNWSWQTDLSYDLYMSNSNDLTVGTASGSSHGSGSLTYSYSGSGGYSSPNVSGSLSSSGSEITSYEFNQTSTRDASGTATFSGGASDRFTRLCRKIISWTSRT